MNTSDSLFNKIATAVIDGDSALVESLVQEALRGHSDPLKIIDQGLTRGVREVGDKFGRGESFLTDLVMAATAMQQGLKLVEPEILRQGKTAKTLGTVVLGTVAGDVHDIGKNIVGAMLRASGFSVDDLGVDVPTHGFVNAIRKREPEIIGLSALMTVTMPEQAKIINELEKQKLRDKVAVIIGGAATSEEWAEEIKADAYAPDAVQGLRKTNELLRRRGKRHD